MVTNTNKGNLKIIEKEVGTKMVLACERLA